ncbi:uncharacterized protein LOC143575173 [Bidens hawaiensis]|uniref:uncharacterized protein LOC143575173 n=1 Tax=Bidens hawaiensis TaxID=980011 RepID=UPI00404ABC17
MKAQAHDYGLRIINPEGQDFTFAIRLEFKSTNNKAEYEALLTGLRIAKKLGAKHSKAHVDSMMVANQIEGTNDAKDEKMTSYLAQAKVIMGTFITWKVKHVKRSENKQADALSKLASVSFEHLVKDVCVEELANPSTTMREVCICSAAPHRGPQFPPWVMVASTVPRTHGMLTNNSYFDAPVTYLGPLLRCVDAQDMNYLLREVHDGICGVHAGPRMVVAKIMNTGYYWPGMHVKAEKELRCCSTCQQHTPKTLRPKSSMISVTSSLSFQKWSSDITGPFPEAPGQVMLLIVAIDYFTKWIEAKPFATISATGIMNFIWEFIICRFGLPMNLVSNNGTQFANQRIKEWLKELNITQTLTFVAYP